MPARRSELLAHDVAQQSPLHRRVDVLEVAAAALAPAYAHGGVDPARRGLDDLDGVGAQERLRAVGDLDPHPLARQRVPDEHDLAVDPGDAVTAVGDGSDVDDDVVA